MLSGEGYQVESALDFPAAVHACEKGAFDLVILCHSIPSEDKAALIKQLRSVCGTPILALGRPNDSPVQHAEYNLDSGDPYQFLSYVKTITNQKAESA